MSLSRSYDGGRLGKPVGGIALTTSVVPSSSGGATYTGATIDRLAYDRRYYSAKSLVRARLISSTVQNVSLAMSFQHSSDGTSWDSFSTATNAATAIGSTGATGAQTVEGSAEQAVSLVGARRYIRQVMVPTFSGGTSGDSLYFQGTVVLAGSDETPNT
jgi:hypothetical protein